MLSCSCDNEYDWYYNPPDDFTIFEATRRKRCVSCNDLINHHARCLKFYSYRDPRSEYEEERFGDQVEMAYKYMCEKCGEIFLNLSAAGYCIDLGNNMQNDLDEYWEITGFRPPVSTDTKEK